MYFGVRTHFSLGESILTPKEVVNLAAKGGHERIAIADVMSVDAMPDLTTAGKKAGVNVTCGVALRVVADPTLREKKKQHGVYPCVYPMSEAGMQDIYELITLANSEDNYYYHAQLGFDQVMDVVNRGNLLFTTGNINGLASTPWGCEFMDSDDLVDGHAAASGLVCGEFVAVASAHYTQLNKRVSAWLQRHPSLGNKRIVSRPALYPKGKHEHRAVMDDITSRRNVESIFRRLPPSDWTMMPKKVIEALASKFKAANFTLPPMYVWEKLDINLPIMSKQPTVDMVNFCKEGWKERILQPRMGYKPEGAKLDEYRARLKYELSILRQMGFENYFLLVRDIVMKAKEKGIRVGPGRGSAGGSLVAYLMGITDVDPIRFGLFFERFINPERLDLPDVDLDFESSRRQEVLTAIEKDYGKEHVACISNYVMLGPSSSLRAVGSAHKLSDDDIACSKQVPKDSGTPIALEKSVADVPALEQFATKHSTAWDQAVGLQGVLRNYGQHAAAVVVSRDPLVKRAPVLKKTKDRLIAWDKRHCENFGLVKMDILGLATLDLHRHALAHIEERHKKRVHLERLGFDDADTIKAFGEGRTKGVFQFEGFKSVELLKKMGVTGKICFDDVVAVTALNRPGPLESGLTDQFMAIYRGDDIEDYPHPSTEAALKETMSVIVYQEQVMQIARDLAGFSMGAADGLRKAMGKKDADLMADVRQDFVDGAKKGWVTVEMEDGTERTFHKAEPIVCTDGKTRTIQEVIDGGYDI